MRDFDKTAEEIRSQSDLKAFREICVKQEKKLVLFGAGDCGHVVFQMLHNANIEVLCFCDNKTDGRTDTETGLKIAALDDLLDKAKDLMILICVVNKEACQSIYGQLLGKGIARNQIRVMTEYYDRLSDTYFETNLENYKKAYGLLEDDRSRQIYLARMKKVFLMTSISEIVSPSQDEYFDEKVILSDHEVFVDCGGFDGSTSVRFIERCRGCYSNIIIFEPERCKKSMIEENMGKNHYELYLAGVWSQSARLNFDALTTNASHISETDSGYQIDVVALDETIYEKNPTFIKMDIEGAEQEALKGCRRIIKEYKPKLAVCIYHKPEDLYEIPSLIKRLNPEYKLYVRQYSDSRYETVLYAL